MKLNHASIARAMCDISDEVLWKPRIKWARSIQPEVNLRFRVGSGKKTYLGGAGWANLAITYGVGMVESKSDPLNMCQWLTSREIVQRKYYGGELTLLNVLAHTMAHEYGHLIQRLRGHRYYGSVHNKHFYEVLDRIHANTDSERLREKLHSAALAQGMDLSAIVATTKTFKVAEDALCIRTVRAGDLVEFIDADSKAMLGNPYKVERKLKTKIQIKSLKNPLQVYRAHPGILRKADLQ